MTIPRINQVFWLILRFGTELNKFTVAENHEHKETVRIKNSLQSFHPLWVTLYINN